MTPGEPRDTLAALMAEWCGRAARIRERNDMLSPNLAGDVERSRNNMMADNFEICAQELDDALRVRPTVPGPEPSVSVLLADLAKHKCSDGYCYLAGPATGMHTNGGCKCLNDIRHPTIRSRLIGILRLARGDTSEGAKP